LVLSNIRRSIVALALVAGCARSRTPCERHIQAQAWSEAVRSCGATAAIDPDAAIAAGRAALQLVRYTEVAWFATLAASTRRWGDAAALRASVATAEGTPREALDYLAIAYAHHLITRDVAAQARDKYQLAQAWSEIGDLGQALDAARVARDLAEQARRARMVVYADLAIAEVVRNLGDLAQAETVIQRAGELAQEPADKVVVWLKQAVIFGDLGHTALMVGSLSRALSIELAAAAPRPPIVQALWLNLAGADRSAGDFAGALARIEKARAAGTDEMSYHLARAQTFRAQGQLAEASRELAIAERTPLTGEWAYVIAFERARVAAQMGDVPAAIAADRRAIDAVTALLDGAGPLAPVLVASFREAYLHLIGLHAGQGRFEDALEVVALLDAQALLGSQASPSSEPGAVIQVDQPAPRAGRRHVSRTELVRAWQGRTLIIAVPDGERLWRLTVRDGRVDGVHVGKADDLVGHARGLERDPTDLAAGRALGDALLAGVPEGRVDVLLVGPIARAPLGALRRGDPDLASQRWQIARVLGVLPASASPAPAGGPSVAIADSEGDLPASSAAATRAARAIGGGVFVGAAANRAALASARGGAVLHVAVHTRLRGTTSVLQLADGDAGEAEIAALAPSPRLVVLANCASAVGSGDGGRGSLALAFVNAGAELVVATLRSVPDADAAQLIDAFYDAGGARDPIRALAAVQATAAAATPAGAGPPVWSAFEVIAGRPAVSGPRSAHASSR
jgi:tetratricopeptide (TPR) repeat protein